MLKEMLIERDTLYSRYETLQTLTSKLAEEITIEFVTAYQNKICKNIFVDYHFGMPLSLMDLYNMDFELVVYAADNSKAFVVVSDEDYIYKTSPINIDILQDKNKRQEFINNYGRY
jgi:hypothetical protein